VALGANLFFKKIRTSGKENLPLDRPVILVANHQNAMLDPVITAICSRKQLHWLTRADVFLRPAMNRLLRSLNMLPVYRERDRVQDISAVNKVTFSECYARLKAHAVICVFPEGTHRGKKQLVPLKKGVSRLAAGALDAGITDVCIVPVGMDYENYYRPRKELLINFGEPIELASYAARMEDERGRLQLEILQKVREGLERQMIDIRVENIYHEVLALHPLCDKLSPHKSVEGRFRFFQRFTERVNADESTHSMIAGTGHKYMQLAHELHLQEDLYEKYHFMTFLWMVLLFPFAAIGGIIYYPVFFFTENFVRKVVKDPLFKNSIRLCFWTFVTPACLLVLFFITWAFLPAMYAALIIGLFIISGIIALQWWPPWQQFRHHMQCRRYEREGNALFAQWKACRAALMKWIPDL
jgi:1-acyl-sn-glycerol-3-phosphate acyltransferase